MLFIGDNVAERLPALREEHAVDLVIVNAENCAVTDPDPAKGFGMTAELVGVLFDSGVGVVTGGNHS